MNQLQLTSGEKYWISDEVLQQITNDISSGKEFIEITSLEKTINKNVIHSYGVPDFIKGVANSVSEFRLTTYGVYAKTQDSSWRFFDGKRWKKTNDDVESLPVITSLVKNNV